MGKGSLIALGSVVAVFVAMAVWLGYQHSVISSQSRTIDSMTSQIESLEKQSKARDKVAKTHKSDVAKAEKERDEYKRKLKAAEADSVCSNTPLSDDTQRVLKELYGSQPSF